VIHFGGLQFSDPQPVVLFGGAPLPALYVFTVFDVRCSPQPYRAIFIGQTGNAAAKLDLDHPAIVAWGESGGFLGLLNVTVHYMPYVRERERAMLAKRLVTQYEPELNQRSSLGSRVSD
jgi:hypothetical protein